MLNLRARTLRATDMPHLMGIVNVTADSFYDGGATASPAAAVAERGGGLVVTHLGIAPKQVQHRRYDIAPAEIIRFLEERARRAIEAGVAPGALVIDPGLGFGKSTSSDMATLRALPDLLA